MTRWARELLLTALLRALAISVATSVTSLASAMTANFGCAPVHVQPPSLAPALAQRERNAGYGTNNMFELAEKNSLSTQSATTKPAAAIEPPPDGYAEHTVPWE